MTNNNKGGGGVHKCTSATYFKVFFFFNECNKFKFWVWSKRHEPVHQKKKNRHEPSNRNERTSFLVPTTLPKPIKQWVYALSWYVVPKIKRPFLQCLFTINLTRNIFRSFAFFFLFFLNAGSLTKWQGKSIFTLPSHNQRIFITNKSYARIITSGFVYNSASL